MLHFLRHYFGSDYQRREQKRPPQVSNVVKLPARTTSPLAAREPVLYTDWIRELEDIIAADPEATPAYRRMDPSAWVDQFDARLSPQEAWDEEKCYWGPAYDAGMR